MHRQTLPDLTTFVAAPNAPPFGPPDDDLIEADQTDATDSNARPPHATAATSLGEDRDGLELIAAAGARRASAPTREEAVQNR
eukprot:4435493-Prymnesium_polylepis.1